MLQSALWPAVIHCHLCHSRLCRYTLQLYQVRAHSRKRMVLSSVLSNHGNNCLSCSILHTVCCPVRMYSEGLLLNALFCQWEWQSDAQLLLKLGVGYWFIGHPGTNWCILQIMYTFFAVLGPRLRAPLSIQKKPSTYKALNHKICTYECICGNITSRVIPARVVWGHTTPQRKFYALSLFLRPQKAMLASFPVLPTPAFNSQPWRKSEGEGLVPIITCCDVG